VSVSASVCVWVWAQCNTTYVHHLSHSLLRQKNFTRDVMYILHYDYCQCYSKRVRCPRERLRLSLEAFQRPASAADLTAVPPPPLPPPPMAPMAPAPAPAQALHPRTAASVRNELASASVSWSPLSLGSLGSKRSVELPPSYRGRQCAQAMLLPPPPRRAAPPASSAQPLPFPQWYPRPRSGRGLF
jgi:hypothetical protein